MEEGGFKWKRAALIGFLMGCNLPAIGLGVTNGERRCFREDSLEESKAKGRNEWAKKCLFIDDEDVSCLLRNGMYVSCQHADGRTKAPTDPQASCDGWSSDYQYWCTWKADDLDQEALTTPEEPLVCPDEHLIPSEKRCLVEDRLDDVEAKQRVEWARKCGLIDDEEVQFNFKKKMYPSFIHKNGRLQAPINREASNCRGWRLEFTCSIRPKNSCG